MKHLIFLLLPLLSIITLSCSEQKQLLRSGCIDAEKIDKGAICPMIYQPVCGCDGKTYSNGCVAQSNGVTEWTEGACSEQADKK